MDKMKTQRLRIDSETYTHLKAISNNCHRSINECVRIALNQFFRINKTFSKISECGETEKSKNLTKWLNLEIPENIKITADELRRVISWLLSRIEKPEKQKIIISDEDKKYLNMIK